MLGIHTMTDHFSKHIFCTSKMQMYCVLANKTVHYTLLCVRGTEEFFIFVLHLQIRGRNKAPTATYA